MRATMLNRNLEYPDILRKNVLNSAKCIFNQPLQQRQFCPPVGVMVGLVFFVDPNLGDDNNDGQSLDTPLRTVGEALTRCRPQMGDTIIVVPNNAWQYHNHADGRLLSVEEEIAIAVPGINLIGVSPSPLGVVWQPINNAGTCIAVYALDVNIEGFCFTEGSHNGVNGILARWNGVTAWADNLAVRNCHFDECVVGIQLDYTWYGNLIGNYFQDCDKAIFCDIADSGIGYMNITDNRIQSRDGYALSLQDCDENYIARNHIWQEEAILAAAGAANKGIDLGSGSYNLVEDNFLSCLLPVPAAGDYNAFNTAGTRDAWINNHCMNGLAVTNPT